MSARRPKRADALGLTASEVAALLGISATSCWHLRRQCPDFPQPLAGLWPKARPLWDRADVLRWWRQRARRAQLRAVQMERTA